MRRVGLLLTVIVCAVLAGTAGASVLSQCPDGDHGCIMGLIHKHSEGVGLPVADTLYRALDSAGRLDPHELLRYGRVKSLIGQYRAAARIYCRAATEDRRIEHAAMTQMAQLLADADSVEKAAAVRIFERCAMGSRDADTALYRNWLADFCGQQGLFEQQISILSRFSTAESPSGRKLADAARDHFSRRRYRLAVTAASAAYWRLDEDQRRSDAAFLTYQSYMQLRVRDSALVWLRLSGVDDKHARIQAIALNQETGHLEAAAALIDSLQASLPKDTLTVRQLLFAGEPVKALNAIMASKSASWATAPRERMLWRGRCMIFSGQVHEAMPVIDSLKFVPSWHAASEILRYRYWVQKLDDSQSALDVWGKLEYAVYIGDMAAAVRLLKGHGMKGEPGEMLAVRLARALAKSQRPAEALEILELADDGGVDYGIKGINRKTATRAPSPEYLYFRAEMLSEAGRMDEARAVANKILVEHPLDIFAQKARILLSKI